ncbi:MotA/TolQ/ExbB proton channel family protein [Roseococcus suduntuyensis]|uniref:Biopolymer transport protein ExbB/TolQ n=1 Tax=Roseococcus suduntuyensis TaxID=455361 RepID=A0A840AER3_9PROT|nr:MotA/TolQ/ExbB proton channel family protein [Roseococcus suduntuyensis]MBB3899611.1 biopolymer transport protein ExbB/TolQ [Roseococcus suduntuyensis]
MPSPDNLHDLSPLGLFLMADWVVRSVMILLLVASLAVWAVAIDRWMRLRRLAHEAALLDRHAAEGGRVPYGRLPDAILGAAATSPEWAGESAADRRARLADAMRLALADTMRPAQSGLPLLASVASAGPFIGLFGTVWGIMNAFTAIARSGESSLATVAPGIAEALFATALGLFAAIPAVLAYNRLAALAAETRARANAGIARLAARPPRAEASRLPRAAE